MDREQHLRELEEKYENYTVYDNQGSRIGKVDDLFVDETDNEEYIGVKMGLFGLKSTLIPTEIVRINEHDRTIEVAESKDRVKDAPNFDDDEDITAEYEERIRSHFGLQSLEASGRGSYSGAASAGGATAPAQDRDTDDATPTERGSSDPETGDESGRARDEDTGRGETAGSTFETTGSTGDRETHRDEPGSSDRETYSDTSEGRSGQTEDGDRHEETGTTSGHEDTGAASASEQEGSTTGQPSNTRQTEETETFREGGRTKVRRRIVREEVIDADDKDAR